MKIHISSTFELFFFGVSTKINIFQTSSFQLILILALIILQDSFSFVFFFAHFKSLYLEVADEALKY